MKVSKKLAFTIAIIFLIVGYWLPRNSIYRQIISQNNIKILEEKKSPNQVVSAFREKMSLFDDDADLYVILLKSGKQSSIPNSWFNYVGQVVYSSTENTNFFWKGDGELHVELPCHYWNSLSDHYSPRGGEPSQVVIKYHLKKECNKNFIIE